MRRGKKQKKRRLHKTELWKRVVVLSIIAMFATIILDVFYRSELERKGMATAIDIIDVPVSVVLIADVYMRFKEARDKKKFVKNNIILIFSVLPISVALIGFRVLRVFPALTELPLLGEVAAFERVIKMQHGAKFMEGLKELVGFK